MWFRASRAYHYGSANMDASGCPGVYRVAPRYRAIHKTELQLVFIRKPDVDINSKHHLSMRSRNPLSICAVDHIRAAYRSSCPHINPSLPYWPSSSSKLGITTSQPGSVNSGSLSTSSTTAASVGWRKRNATRDPFWSPVACNVSAVFDFAMDFFPVASSPCPGTSVDRRIHPFSRSLLSTGKPNSTSAGSFGIASPLISRSPRDARAPSSFSFADVRGSCGCSERRTVVLCFLKSSVHDRESDLACFGGCPAKTSVNNTV